MKRRKKLSQISPFGDGKAAEKIVEIIQEFP
jgi:UDP-N-acetylglucosamine 2-epimerase